MKEIAKNAMTTRTQTKRATKAPYQKYSLACQLRSESWIFAIAVTVASVRSFPCSFRCEIDFGLQGSDLVRICSDISADSCPSEC
jgi:hypothetical protein